VAAKDLQLVGKNLQMAGPNNVRGSTALPEALNGPSNPQNNFSFGNALRRQWLLVFLVALISTTAAYLVSSEFKTAVITAHVQLISNPLPLSSRAGVYKMPSADIVAEMLMSPEVLQDAVEEFGLPVSQILEKSLKAHPDTKAGTLEIDRALTDDENLIAALDEIGSQLSVVVRDQRVEMLDSHASYVQGLLLPASQALDQARGDLIDELRNGVDVRQTAELQALVPRRKQLESHGRSGTRRLTRIDRDLAYLSDRKTRMLPRAMQRVLQGRLRQVESYATGLTSATRSFAMKQKLLVQLQELQASLPVTKDSDSPVSQPESLSQEEQHITAANPADSGMKAPTAETSSSAAKEQLSAEEIFFAWHTQILDVGHDSLGAFDPATMKVIEVTQADLQAAATTARRLEVERIDLSADVNDVTIMIAKTDEELTSYVDIGRQLPSNPSSQSKMAAEASVTQSSGQECIMTR
jgi:hypothetical protein